MLPGCERDKDAQWLRWNDARWALCGDAARAGLWQRMEVPSDAGRRRSPL
jgi:hypothetical protein